LFPNDNKGLKRWIVRCLDRLNRGKIEALVKILRDSQPGADELAKTIANEADYKRIAVICALELASGRMVWCSSLADRFMGKYVDITSPDEGRALLKELLAEF